MHQDQRALALDIRRPLPPAVERACLGPGEAQQGHTLFQHVTSSRYALNPEFHHLGETIAGQQWDSDTSPTDVQVLIPSAARHPEVATVVNVGLTPLDGEPVLIKTLRYLNEAPIAGIRIGAPSADEISVAIMGSLNLQVPTYVTNMDSVSLLDTIAQLLEQFQGDKPTLVILGDTYVEFESWAFLSSADPIVFTSEISDPYRWCCVEVSVPGSRVTALHNKSRSLSGEWHACVGAYFFPSSKELHHLVERSRQRPDISQDLEGPLTSLVSQGSLQTRAVSVWLDAGHLDRAAVASSRMLSARTFNSITVDALRGTVTKKSRDRGKIQSEIDYLRQLPTDAAVLFPRVLHAGDDGHTAWYTRERYGYPSLRELYLWHQVEPRRWAELFSHLHDLVSQVLGAHPDSLSPDDQWLMYWDKPNKRVSELLRQPAGEPLVSESLTINGRPNRGFMAMGDDIQEALNGLTARGVGQLIHGDLCFSNILYDLGSSTCRFIDPRGSFGQSRTTGDARYDHAKLWHSLGGWYEHLAEDLLSLNWQDSSHVEFSIPLTRRQRHIQREFADVFLAEDSFRDVALITGLTLCSVASLHDESWQRQQALYLRGVMMLNDFFESKE